MTVRVFVDGCTEMDQVLGLMSTTATSPNDMMNMLRRVLPCRVNTRDLGTFTEPARPFHTRRPPRLP